MSKPELTFKVPDSRGYVPDLTLIGSQWKHTGNEHVYSIVGFAYNGEDDTWMIQHTRLGSDITYMRTPSNFFAHRGDKGYRYVRA